MRCDPSIVAVRASEIGQLPDLADVTEKRKITVDSSETDVRIDLSKILVYCICRWMICSGSQKFLDGFSLTAVFKCCHNDSSLLVIVIITDINITDRRGFVNEFCEKIYTNFISIFCTDCDILFIGNDTGIL